MVNNGTPEVVAVKGEDDNAKEETVVSELIVAVESKGAGTDAVEFNEVLVDVMGNETTSVVFFEIGVVVLILKEPEQSLVEPITEHVLEVEEVATAWEGEVEEVATTGGNDVMVMLELVLETVQVVDFTHSPKESVIKQLIKVELKISLLEVDDGVIQLPVESVEEHFKMLLVREEEVAEEVNIDEVEVTTDNENSEEDVDAEGEKEKEDEDEGEEGEGYGEDDEDEKDEVVLRVVLTVDEDEDVEEEELLEVDKDEEDEGDEVFVRVVLTVDEGEEGEGYGEEDDIGDEDEKDEVVLRVVLTVDEDEDVEEEE